MKNKITLIVQEGLVKDVSKVLNATYTNERLQSIYDVSFKPYVTANDVQFVNERGETIPHILPKRYNNTKSKLLR